MIKSIFPLVGGVWISKTRSITTALIETHCFPEFCNVTFMSCSLVSQKTNSVYSVFSHNNTDSRIRLSTCMRIYVASGIKLNLSTSFKKNHYTGTPVLYLQVRDLFIHQVDVRRIAVHPIHHLCILWMSRYSFSIIHVVHMWHTEVSFHSQSSFTRLTASKKRDKTSSTHLDILWELHRLPVALNHLSIQLNSYRSFNFVKNLRMNT